MSVQTEAVVVGIPEWTLTDRLRKAREYAGYTQTDLAQATGISRASIQNYEAGKTKPGKPVLLSWAFACGVSNNWLCHGDTQTCLGGPGEGVSAGGRGVMIPCSWQGQTRINRVISLPFRPIPLPIPQAA